MGPMDRKSKTSGLGARISNRPAKTAPAVSKELLGVWRPFAHQLPSSAWNKAVNSTEANTSSDICWRHNGAGRWSLPFKTRSSATAKSTARPSCSVGVLYDISRERICWWLNNHFYVIGHESYTEFGEITQNNGHHNRSRSFNIADFGINRKPIYDFLLAININLHPILHRFKVMADYMSNFC